tara:strand:+ start:1588 stop:1800 length:213 start_codon:yes stop_codon:yes gene_type:complete
MKNFLVPATVFVAACLAFALFFGLPIMWLWNHCLVGAIDGVHEIGFLQALGITVLVALLTYKPGETTNNN